MKKQHFHYFNQIAMMILLILTFFGCQQNNSINEPKISNDQGFHKDGGLRIPDTYLEGYVYKQGSTLQGATVKLYKSGVFKTQTTSNSSGFYNIMICPYGYGNYTVTGYYKDKWNEVWTDSESFVFDEESADSLDYTYSINLYLGTSK